MTPRLAMHRKINEEAGLQHYHSQQHPAQVERNDKPGEQEGKQTQSQSAVEHDARVLPAFAIDLRHGRRKELCQQQHSKLTNDDGHVLNRVFPITHAHHKIDHGGKGGEQQRTRHTFTVEHKEEGEIDECRARLLLQHNEQHGQDEKGTGGYKVLRFAQIKTVAAHELSHRQRHGELGKLGWLQLDASAQRNPRM